MLFIWKSRAQDALNYTHLQSEHIQDLKLRLCIQTQGHNQDLNLAKQKYEILTGHKSSF